ncbi:MAG: methyltransferase domain-containing protein [Treponema sp.]|nr:methyltransferase domain-containing protein [Treponema sp.]
MTALEKYYNKFNEDHRLTTRHGLVEFTTSLKYIHDFIPEGCHINILDVGAGTGRYSVALANEGHNVTAVELVPRNLAVLESKHANVNCWPGNAMDLHFLPDAKFDITLLFGPLYHLHTQEEQLKAFAQARRVTKKGGIIFAAYVMNEYSIISYCFKKNKIKECVQNGELTADFHTVSSPDQLYTYFRLEDIDALNKKAGFERIKIIAADGPSDYMRQTLNAMDEEEFALFLKYHLSTCERPELLGASSHTVDILRN